ncbi:hypothetical protein AB4Z21_15245, partial [Paenibacillus sp. MCAF20]
AQGYYGFAGIDTVITEDNDIYIIDLNFRQNGSTVALLFQNSVAVEWGATVMKARKWKSNLSFDEFELHARSLIADKRLLPLCIYNPAMQTADKPIFLSGAVVGKSKADVLETERHMLTLGFE